LEETRAVRVGDWQIAPLPDDLQDRRSEITGPVDRKMMINALNSGACVFMADLEDSNTPHWHNQIQRQINLRDAYDRSISFTNPEGKHYALKDGRLAVMLIRPRGLHMEEKHLLVEGESSSGSLLDVGLYLFHNAQRALDAGTGSYFYLPKIEGHLEARWFNEVFTWSEQRLGIPHGSIKATVLIETILAAFEMEEIIYELRDHMAGLNAGRWDYMFSAIKKFHHDPDSLWPDRSQVTMTVPMMRAYTELMVRTCHKRGAHAIGGMTAFIPSRKDSEVNSSKVTTDMIRTMIPEELEVIRKEHGAAYHEESTLQATKLFESLVTSDTFEEFLTTQAYDLIE
jgi:malate synthase